MNIQKNIQAVGAVLSAFDGSLNYTKLLKILYFINRQSLSERGRAVIEDSYANMPNGVVLSGTYDLIKNRYTDSDIQEYWNSFFMTQNVYYLKARTDILPEGELSRYEKKIIAENIERYRDFSFGQMIDLHHDKKVCPEWQNPNGSSLPLAEQDILSVLGYSKSDIDFISEDKKIFEEETRRIAVRG